MRSDPSSRDCLVVEARVARAHDGGRIELSVDSAAACRACAGTCMWQGRRGGRLGPFSAGRDIKAGSCVSVSIPAAAVLLSATFVYGLPLFLMLTGALLGSGIFPGELAAVLGALLGLIGGFSLLRLLTPGLQRIALDGLSIREVP